MVLAIAGPQSPWLALKVLTFGLCAARCSGPLCGLLTPFVASLQVATNRAQAETSGKAHVKRTVDFSKA